MKLIDIRGERKRRGWTQDELAERAGIAQTTLSAIEIGHVKNPSFDIMKKLAVAFELDPRVLTFPVTDNTQEVA